MSSVRRAIENSIAMQQDAGVVRVWRVPLQLEHS